MREFVMLSLLGVVTAQINLRMVRSAVQFDLIREIFLGYGPGHRLFCVFAYFFSLSCEMLE